METLVIEVFKSVATQGPLVGFLFYLYVQNEKKIEAKDAKLGTMTDVIIAMHKETINTVAHNTASNDKLRETINDLKSN